MTEEIWESFCAQDTFEAGRNMARKSCPGTVILLNGDLGTGKTVFTQGFGKEIGIEEPISSPTFTILQIYDEGKMPLYHFDVYRIADPEEMEEIGYEDYFYGNGACIVEWAELISDLIPEGAVSVLIEKDLDRGEDYRRITVRKPV